MTAAWLKQISGLLVGLLTALTQTGCVMATTKAPASSTAIPVGTNHLEILCGTNLITVFTYKPKSYRDGPLLVVFHGRSRNAQDYRDYAISLAERLKAIVAAPLFDQARYPIHAYTLGGVIENDTVQPRENWFFPCVRFIVDELRQHEGKAALDYFLVGHSAGGQMLMRLAAIHPMDARRIVVANPGSDLFPRRDWEFGYGFGGLPTELSDDAALQRYLAAPLTLYLGTADILTDEDNLDRSESAMLQGAHRLERGRACFGFAESLARERGWKFNWRKVETAGIGHDGKGMLAAKEVEDALFAEGK